MPAPALGLHPLLIAAVLAVAVVVHEAGVVRAEAEALAAFAFGAFADPVAVALVAAGAPFVDFGVVF